MANQSITAPKGFQVKGLSCGIKQSGNPDLGVIYCPTGAKAAAVFTTNQVVSAAVEVCREHAKSAKVYAIVANSGNANACTGKQGHKDAVAMCQQTAQELACEPHQVLVASTGIIGQPLPMPVIISGIRQAAAGLSDAAKSGLDFAKAIMTTDTRPKQTVRCIKIAGKDVTLAGTVKGAGMIGPNMATTLCFMTTDMAISKSLLNRAIKQAIGNSLNRLTVDGHQSTNDTAILLTSGLAGNPVVTRQDKDYAKFAKALNELCDDLARQMALDAEGATRMFKVVIKGAATQADAAIAARAVADYDLVKCAVNGGDPNWGRIVCAVGSSRARVNPGKLTCKLDRLTVFRNGQPAKFDVKQASQIVSRKEHTITVDLGMGKVSDFCYGVDLSRDYVTINADYHT
ncbi:MAG: bifunctional glutamate N-acetyltransferase/amino-acid acetyltransferase ArgJ [Phycisphaeraceae bacterium]|nr:bifunctional glutamate N-acetyltransferase/amino-acid acetyltransferase ArgJ [Phycisphaeraceae bacterium]